MLVEFALAFPILLITFIFAIQLLFVFIYDILGSYAAFAAARSFSTLQDEELAKGVAAAVMSVWTIPTVGELEEELLAAEPPDGVREFLEFTRLITGDSEKANLLRYRTALGRMDFKVATNETSNVFLKDGFMYEGAKEDQRPLRGVWAEFKVSPNPIYRFIAWIKEKSRKEEEARYEAQIGVVEFSYDFTQTMLFARFSYLGRPASTDDGTRTFRILQRCAAPIQPKWKPEAQEFEAPPDRLPAVNYQQLLEDISSVIISNLNKVYDFVSDSMGTIGDRDYTQSFDSFFIEPSETRDRSNVKTWEKDLNETNNLEWTVITRDARMTGADASEKKIGRPPRLQTQDMTSQVDMLEGLDSSINWKEVTHVLLTVKKDNDYRAEMTKNGGLIDQEIEQIDSELANIKGIRDHYKRWNVLDAIDKGGWKTTGETDYYTLSGWQRSTSPGDTIEETRTVPVTVGTNTTYRTEYRIRIKNQGAINTDKTTALNSASGLKTNNTYDDQYFKFQKNEINQGNCDHADYSDTTLNNRAADLRVVWNNRREREEAREEENDAIRDRFIELMSASIIPIADYYRVQRRILEDQQKWLKESGLLRDEDNE